LLAAANAGYGAPECKPERPLENYEIERKFLVRDDSWRSGVTESSSIRQAYLRSDDDGSIRVRLRQGKPATLTIKSKAVDMKRLEIEYEIPLHDAELLFGLCVGIVIEKVRHIVPWGGLTWEIDVFSGDHQGLVIAEVELQSATEEVELPPWVGPEVTGDPSYYNSALARRLPAAGPGNAA